MQFYTFDNVPPARNVDGVTAGDVVDSVKAMCVFCFASYDSSLIPFRRLGNEEHTKEVANWFDNILGLHFLGPVVPPSWQVRDIFIRLKNIYGWFKVV